MADVILTQHVGDSPAEIMRHLNYTFEKNLQSECLMSAIHVQISQDIFLKTAIAGHSSLIIVPADKSKIVTFSSTGTMIGVISESMFDIQEKTNQLMIKALYILMVSQKELIIKEINIVNHDYLIFFKIMHL